MRALNLVRQLFIARLVPHLRPALHYTAYPPLQWINIATGEGTLRVVATCLIAVVVPALGGLYYWRYTLAHFDRLIGRPCKETAAATGRLAVAHIGIASRRSCIGGEVVS